MGPLHACKWQLKGKVGMLCTRCSCQSVHSASLRLVYSEHYQRKTSRDALNMHPNRVRGDFHWPHEFLNLLVHTVVLPGLWARKVRCLLVTPGFTPSGCKFRVSLSTMHLQYA